MYKVFIVDDEPFILEGLRAIIRWEEYGLTIIGQASNGADTLALLQDMDTDIVITDIKMPKMNGLELIQKVKKMRPNVRFIILSGYNDFDYVKESITLGIENYLLKPINVQELISTLQNTVHKIAKDRNKTIYAHTDWEILRSNILYRWLTNNIEPRELRERASLLHISLNCPYYIAAVIKILFDVRKGHIPPDPKASQIADEAHALCRQTLQSFAFESDICFCDPEDHIVLVFGRNTVEQQKETIKEVLRRIGANIQSTLNADVCITLGNTEASYLTVHESYANAKNALAYHLVTPDNDIIDFEEIQFFAPHRPIDLQIEWAVFSKLLISQDTDALFSFIDDTFETLQANKALAPSHIHCLIIEILLNIENTLNVLNIQDFSLSNDYKSLFENLLKLQTVQQLKEMVKNTLRKTIDCLASKEQTANPVITRILNYINVHYAEELSLKTLGAAFNINATYLGQIFQKETQEVFSSYVNKLRLQKAKQMLLDTSLKANEIAAKVGYTDSNYFYKIFKKNIGISPTAFRKYKSIV